MSITISINNIYNLFIFLLVKEFSKSQQNIVAKDKCVPSVLPCHIFNKVLQSLAELFFKPSGLFLVVYNFLWKSVVFSCENGDHHTLHAKAPIYVYLIWSVNKVDLDGF